MKLYKKTAMALAMILALVALLTTAGCANKYEQNHMGAARFNKERLVVAVMPFQGVSESPGSGLIVADVLANEIYALGGYTLITPELTATRVAAREGEALSPEEIGKLVGAPFIITGRVTEYTYKSGVGEQPAVAVTARLIECRNGRVLWSATRARTGSAAWFQEDSLGLLTSRICHDLALSLNGEAQKYAWAACEDDYCVEAYPLEKSGPEQPASQDSVSAAPQPEIIGAPAQETAPVSETLGWTGDQTGNTYILNEFNG